MAKIRIDPIKIQKKETELNKSTPGQTWLALEGGHALTSLKIAEDGSFSFNLERGMLIKIFWNKTTGEMKIFPLREFE